MATPKETLSLMGLAEVREKTGADHGELLAVAREMGLKHERMGKSVVFSHADGLKLIARWNGMHEPAVAPYRHARRAAVAVAEQ